MPVCGSFLVLEPMMNYLLQPFLTPLELTPLPQPVLPGHNPPRETLHHLVRPAAMLPRLVRARRRIA